MQKIKITTFMILILFVVACKEQPEKEQAWSYSEKESFKITFDSNSKCKYFQDLGQLEVDESLGRQIYKKNCDNGMATACLALGRIAFRQGNKSEAKALTKKSCEMKDRLACKVLEACSNELN